MEICINSIRVTRYLINTEKRDSTTVGTMRSLLITLILLSVGFKCRAQLNYEGNPLTETIDYTAQESKATRLNAHQNYQRFEVTDGRMINLSRLPFAPSAMDPLTAGETRTSSTVKNVVTKKPPRQTASADDDSFLPEPDQRLRTVAVPASGPTTDVEGSPSETRQSHEYPDQSAGLQSHQQTSQSYLPAEMSPTNENPAIHPHDQINEVSDQALRQFLNSRTPEESEMALRTYLTARTRDEHARRSVDQSGIVRSAFDEKPENRESSPQVQLQQRYPGVKWNQITAQLRRDGFHSGPSMMRPRPVYRGPVRARASPWAQSRIALGPSSYRPREAIYGRPPPAAINGHWKQPVELIYTKPPDRSAQLVLGGPPIPHEDATGWFRETDHPPSPTQKDVYYSQLYAQSYDPHYYNYIAKTGKIKPWLYGKLGKTEEKSIWWELLTGFKNHGMKNMMNPMFLLGMSIPTLTLALSALIQKRSAARANGYHFQDFVDGYESQIREAISAHEDGTKETAGLDASHSRNVRKRSVGPAGLRASEEDFLRHRDRFAADSLAHDRELKGIMESDEKEADETRVGSANSISRKLEPFVKNYSTRINRLGEEATRDEQRPDRIKLD